MAKTTKMEDMFASLRKTEDEAREEGASKAVSSTIKPVVGNPFEDEEPVVKSKAKEPKAVSDGEGESSESAKAQKAPRKPKDNEVTLSVNDLFSNKGKTAPCKPCCFTLDADVVDEIDKAATKYNMSKSKIVNEILKTVLINNK